MLARGNTLEEFCQDLRSYLEGELRRIRTHVVVRVGRLVKLRGEPWKRISPYSAYLRRLFGEYKFAKGTYIVSREKAEEVYNNLDALCETLKKKKRRRRQKREEIIRSEKMVLVTFHIPNNMLRDLDEVAKMMGKRRAEVIREAIRQMLERMANTTPTPEEKDVLEELVRCGMHNNIEDAIHDIAYQLAQRLNLA
jgi:Arc/MetJ-type ribon-helix-helix transcriptional regulator